jgi:hypothetical protein
MVRAANQSWPRPPTLPFRADQEPNLLKTNSNSELKNDAKKDNT